MAIIYGLIIGLIALVSIVVALNGLRVPIRHIWRRRVRSGLSGEMYWYQIVPESRGTTGASQKIQQQLSAIRSFTSRLNTKRPYFDRGISSIIWNKGDDGLIRLYIGVSRNSLGEGSVTVHSLANSLHCRAEELEGPPDIPTKGLVFAKRDANTPTNIKSQPESLGSLALELSEAKQHRGAIILTAEHMRNSESKRFENYISEFAIMKAGKASQFSSSTADHARTVTASGVRTTIGAVSSTGRASQSNDMLKLTMGAIPSLGFNYQTVEPGVQTAKWAGWSLVILGLFTTLGLLTGAPWKYVLIATLPGALVNLANLIMPRKMSTEFYERQLEDGEIIVPSFSWWSMRFWIHGMYNSTRYNTSSSEGRAQKIAAPSCSQVIPMYSTSIAEYITIPDSIEAVDIYTDPVPLHGFPANFERPSGDALFLGFSGVGQETYYPLSDIHYNSFTAGVAGSGKTNHLQVKYGGLTRYGEHNSDDLKITSLWTETKGEGAYQTWSMVKDIPKAVFIDAHNPRSPMRLALEGRRLSEGASVREVVSNANILVSGLQFANGDGIKASSREVLDFSFRIALLMKPSEIRYLDLDEVVDPEKPNVIELAYFIIGGDESIKPGPALKRLRDEIEQKGIGKLSDRERYLVEAVGTLSPYLDDKNRGAQERKMSPLNKLTEIRNASEFWTPSDQKQDVYIGQIPAHFAPIVLNMGPFWDSSISAFSREISKIVNSRLMKTTTYLIWSYVQAHCSGWNDMGKRCIMFSDEVADIAQDAEGDDTVNILDEISKEGRSRGFGIHCASQNLGQLPDQTVREVLSFRTLYLFKLPNDQDASRVLSNIEGGKSKYTVQNIQSLPDGTCIVGRMKFKSQGIQSFTLFVPKMSVWRDYLNRVSDVKEAAHIYGDERHFTDYDTRRKEVPSP